MTSPLVFFVLAFFAFSGNADVNIDCGASSSSTDENFIPWIGDADLFQDGQSAVVQSSITVMSTLRFFTTRKKNCYAIPVDKGPVLVRASFFYGNYDKKSSPPSFDLHFDGNYWTTVRTSLDQLVYYEVIYDVNGDQISVCLAQTQPNQFPFISALEVKSLGSNMYSHVDPNHALFLRKRIAYGANKTIRFSDDAYDRIWVPANVDSGLASVSSDAIIIDVNAPDNPPEAILRTAVTSSSISDAIVVTPGLPDIQVPIYINMYFSETTQLDSTQKRSFQIYINDKPNSEPIIPPYEGVIEMYVTNIAASSNTSFKLVATADDSTLPPLINAMEVFFVSDPLTHGTDSKDMQGLGQLQTAYDVLQEWVGDPCLPSPYSWDWLNCSIDAIPRVTSLDLSSFDLTGPLPDFSSMDALETIDLHNNSISGPIPDFFGTLTNLRELNLADNSFSGPIPTSLSRNNKLKLVVSGNSDLCTSDNSCQPTSTGSGPRSGSSTQSGKKKSKNLPVILGTTIPGFLIFWAIVGTLAVFHQKRKTAAISTVTPGQGGGANGSSQGSPANVVMGKLRDAVINEIKVNIQDQTTTTENQSDTQAQQSN